ncbi:MAG TPA: NUDIX hydrolase [Acidimicrobiales bacterium]|jgi:8-oxo-dGTP pyrophosphatase MutT (NUDIX family)
MREWLVGGAVIEGPEGVLLVANRRRGGTVDWTPPGGVIDPGEELLAGLAREVAEETGLRVGSWEGPIYEIEAEAPDLGWKLRVEAHRAVDVTGDLVIDDPDGIVVDACYVPGADCPVRLSDAHVWVREPLAAWLDERWDGTRRFAYRVDGADLATIQVARLA